MAKSAQINAADNISAFSLSDFKTNLNPAFMSLISSIFTVFLKLVFVFWLGSTNPMEIIVEIIKTINEHIIGKYPFIVNKYPAMIFEIIFIM